MVFNPKQLVILCLSLFSFSAFCGEVIQSHVSYNKGIYKASFEMQIQAPLTEVYALFTDFNHLSRLSKNITDSLLLEENPPEYIVEVDSHNCILFFCKNLTQTQYVLEFDEGYISVEDIEGIEGIEGKSDFIFANTVWHIRTFKNGTRVTFSAEMKPDFWLPPVLGPWLFKNKMISDTRKMIERLEQLASDKQ